MPKMVNCSVVKKLMVLGKWPYLMVFGQMTFSLGCLPAPSQQAPARHLPKPLKIMFALSSINCYEVKALKIVNGRTANVFICPSSINRPSYSLKDGRGGRRVEGGVGRNAEWEKGEVEDISIQTIIKVQGIVLQRIIIYPRLPQTPYPPFLHQSRLGLGEQQ